MDLASFTVTSGPPDIEDLPTFLKSIYKEPLILLKFTSSTSTSFNKCYYYFPYLNKALRGILSEPNNSLLSASHTSTKRHFLYKY